jgi:uncharacterized membrane protein
MFSKKNRKLGFFIALGALALAAVALTVSLAAEPVAGPPVPAALTTRAPITDGSDLVIPLAEVTSVVSFSPVVVDGVPLEVLAVRAPDDTVRTAFNTCQVCYDSGRGYYVQEGNVLVCQNCGNRFRLDQVEVTRGGCNPWPILPGEKTVDDVNITIPASYLSQAKVLFGNWKVEY